MNQSRIVEHNYLKSFYDREDNQIIVLYGQKNNGLSDFISDFLRDKEYDYYLARCCSESEQIHLWKNELKEDLPKNADIPNDYNGILTAVLSKKTEKRVILIDEFQNIVKNSDEFMSSLIKLAHDKWNNQPVLFLLCSESVYWVENVMVEKLGESAFEISGLLKLNELKFLDLVRRFKNYKLKSCVEMYSVVGGYEELWDYFDENKQISENICNNILKKNSHFYELGMHILPEELREPTVYNTILLALSSGREKLNDIYKYTGFSRAKISVYLKNLINLGIVYKVDSYDTAGKENAQKGIYRIAHPFVNFWYCYIYSNLSKLNFTQPEKFYTKYIAPTFKNYTAQYFTEVCMEYLDLMNKMGQLSFKYTKKGSWVGKVGTIDIIAQDDSGKTLVAICNWEKNVLSYDDFEWLVFCVKQARLKVNDFYLFSAGSFDEKLTQEASLRKNIYLIDSTQL